MNMVKVILFDPTVTVKPMADPLIVHKENEDEKCHPCIHLRQRAESKQTEALECLRAEIRILEILIVKAKELSESIRQAGRNTDGVLTPRHIDAADSSVTKIPHDSGL